MRVAVTGSRSITDRKFVWDAIEAAPFTVDELVYGVSPTGVDQLACKWADANKVRILPFPADWTDLSNKDGWIKEGAHGLYDARAGFRRNQKMIDAADACIGIWDAKSRGTKDAMERAKEKGIPIFAWIRNGSYCRTIYVGQDKRHCSLDGFSSIEAGEVDGILDLFGFSMKSAS